MTSQDTLPTFPPPLPYPSPRVADKTAPASSDDRPHLDLLSKGFDLSALAGTFIAAIQSQIMSTTLAVTDQTIAIQAINAFYVGGLILDLLAASLSFLTARWLQRLSEKEKDRFETELSQKNRQGKKPLAFGSFSFGSQEPASGHPEEEGKNAQAVAPLHERFFYAWLSLSLFIPLPLLVIGVVCMIVGLYTYVWTQQPRAVAIVVTVAGGVALPFVAGVFLIGQKEERRAIIISRLVTMQGDW